MPVVLARFGLYRSQKPLKLVVSPVQHAPHEELLFEFNPFTVALFAKPKTPKEKYPVAVLPNLRLMVILPDATPPLSVIL